MYIFLDESGTHKPQGRSVIALVYVSIENIAIFNSAIVKIEKEIGKGTFHWSHSVWPEKERFISMLSAQDITIKIAFIKNPFYQDKAYQFALQNLVTESNIHAIIIDGKKGKTYDRKVKKILRDKNISVKNLHTADDESYPALRAADAIAGLIRYKHDKPEDKRANAMYSKLRQKIQVLVE